MKARVVVFRAHHLAGLTPQPEQRAELDALTPEAARAYELSGRGYSILVGDKPVACAVLVEVGDGRGSVQAFIGADAGPHMLLATRVAERMFRESCLRRIEALVVAGFSNGARWTGLLGFELETPNGMRAFGPNGETYLLYARIM